MQVEVKHAKRVVRLDVVVDGIAVALWHVASVQQVEDMTVLRNNDDSDSTDPW